MDFGLVLVPHVLRDRKMRFRPTPRPATSPGNHTMARWGFRLFERLNVTMSSSPIVLSPSPYPRPLALLHSRMSWLAFSIHILTGPGPRIGPCGTHRQRERFLLCPAWSGSEKQTQLYSVTECQGQSLPPLHRSGPPRDAGGSGRFLQGQPGSSATTAPGSGLLVTDVLLQR